MPADHGRDPPHRAPLRPDRIRRITAGFAFLPNDFLHRGFFASLDHAERSLYFFLVLAGDRNGVSYYAHDRICTALEMTLDDYLVARDRLIDMDLIAFDGRRFQVLSLPPAPIAPPRPLVTQDDFEGRDPATIQRIVRSALDRRRWSSRRARTIHRIQLNHRLDPDRRAAPASGSSRCASFRVGQDPAAPPPLRGIHVGAANGSVRGRRQSHGEVVDRGRAHAACPHPDRHDDQRGPVRGGDRIRDPRGPAVDREAVGIDLMAGGPIRKGPSCHAICRS